MKDLEKVEDGAKLGSYYFSDYQECSGDGCPKTKHCKCLEIPEFDKLFAWQKSVKKTASEKYELKLRKFKNALVRAQARVKYVSENIRNKPSQYTTGHKAIMKEANDIAKEHKLNMFFINVEDSNEP